jgi:hypothetical protein
MIILKLTQRRNFMTDIGINYSGINQDVIVGKEVGKFGKTIEEKEKAVKLAETRDGSEIVFKDKDGNWAVSELAEEGVLWGTDNLSKDDKDDISLDSGKMNKAGMKNAVISFVEDKAEDFTRADIAADPKTSPALLSQLAKDGSIYVQAAALANPGTPSALVIKAAESGEKDLRMAAAANPKLPLTSLKKLLSDGEPEVRLAVALNPSIPEKILRELAYDLDINIRTAVSINPKTPVKTLREMGSDNCLTVLTGLALNKNTPGEVLKKIAEGKPDPDSQDYLMPILGELKEALHKNPNVPKDALDGFDKKYQELWNAFNK